MLAFSLVIQQPPYTSVPVEHIQAVKPILA